MWPHRDAFSVGHDLGRVQNPKGMLELSVSACEIWHGSFTANAQENAVL